MKTKIASNKDLSGELHVCAQETQHKGDWLTRYSANQYTEQDPQLGKRKKKKK